MVRQAKRLWPWRQILKVKTLKANSKSSNLKGEATIENPIFSLIEAVCISWFTIEYFLRLAGFFIWQATFCLIAQQLSPIPTVVIPILGAPEKLKFLKGPLNIVDILAILPYYLSLAFTEEVRNLSYSKLSLLDTFVQESLFPLEVTEQPFEVEVTTTSTSVLAEEDEGEEGTNFDEMSRIIQVSSYFHLPDR